MEPTLLEKKIVKSVSAKKESKLVPGILITITVLFLSLSITATHNYFSKSL